MSTKEGSKEEHIEELKGFESILDPYIPKISKSLRNHLSKHFEIGKLNRILKTLATPVRFLSLSLSLFKILKKNVNNLNEV